MRVLLIILFLYNCDIKKNPLAPNGPFGILSLNYNLSKVGDWSYKEPNVIYGVNTVITENKPNITNRAIVTNFSTKDTLPEGLLFNNSNGALSGIPTAEQTQKEYTIFANNSFFNEFYPTKLKITVGGFSYPNSPYSFQILRQVDIPQPTFTNITTDGLENFTISPSLPSGISINPTTGAMTGTAPQTSSNIVYTVSAKPKNSNLVWSTTLTIFIYQWVNEAYLKAPNAEIDDLFGSPVAIAGDTIVVAAEDEDSNQTTITNGLAPTGINGATNSGAVYVFRRNGTTWSNEAYLKAPNSNSGDRFGSSFSLSGDTIVVGAKGEDSNQTTITNGATASSDNSMGIAGAAYVFKRSGNTWSNEAYLKAPNTSTLDEFGGSVSISGDTIVVGASNEDSNQTTITNGSLASADDSALSSGAAYVFRRNGTLWLNEAYLKAPNSEGLDRFGNSVSISGDTIIVGANWEYSNQTTITNGTLSSSNNLALNSGAVYVFKRNGNTWSNEAYLKAPNAEADDEFGFSISISGDTIVVGTAKEDSLQTTITNGTLVQISDTGNNLSVGAAYVFRRTGSTWSNEAYLKAPNAEGGTGGNGDQFGFSVSIDGDTIVVGAANEDSLQTTITNGILVQASDQANNTSAGTAYVFKRTTGNIWVNEAYLKAPNSEGSDRFGYSVSISGDTIVVGAFGDDSLQTTITNGTLIQASDNSFNYFVGAAYVYVRK
ncbi:MAG: FG-GAP repeat protein [Leptospiraceae bacterium]|nr:FG-GAP repeat protein [Leptospiraceae bacterium]